MGGNEKLNGASYQLYLHDPNERCEQCGGEKYMSAVYLGYTDTGWGTGWHVMLEERCHGCDLVSVTEVPLFNALRAAARAWGVSDVKTD